MSWLNKITSGIFTNSQYQEQTLPHPPSIIAAGAPWYEEISPPKEEIIKRIRKDILQNNPELKSIQLNNIIEEIMKGISIGSYRDYYSNRHRILVNEIREDALEIYKNHHNKNMQWFYFTSMTKVRVHSMIKRFRKRRRLRLWEKDDNLS